MPKLSPEAQKKRNAAFAETMRKKREAAAPKGAVVPLDELVPGGSRHGPHRIKARTTASSGQGSGQPPIVVTFGKVKITIELGE